MTNRDDITRIETRRLAVRADRMGEAELAAAERGGPLFTPLAVRHPETIPGFARFAARYETWKHPIHETDRALQRINDLVAAGAPRTPAEIDATTMRCFRPADTLSASPADVARAVAADQWIAAQGALSSGFAAFMESRARIAPVARTLAELDGAHLAVLRTHRATAWARTDARHAAQSFGAALGGRDQTVMIALVAEAYQELDAFAQRAHEEAVETLAAGEPLRRWLHETYPRYEAERASDVSGFVTDFERIVFALRDTVEGKAYLDYNAPGWHETAATWRGFFAQVMGREFH